MHSWPHDWSMLNATPLVNSKCNFRGFTVWSFVTQDFLIMSIQQFWVCPVDSKSATGTGEEDNLLVYFQGVSKTCWLASVVPLVSKLVSMTSHGTPRGRCTCWALSQFIASSMQHGVMHSWPHDCSMLSATPLVNSKCNARGFTIWSFITQGFLIMWQWRWLWRWRWRCRWRWLWRWR